MHQQEISRALAGLPLGAWRFLEKVDSTNDEGRRWSEAGAPDIALVIAEEQTAGRGRQGRRWFTPPGAALAFSLVLREAQPDGLLPYGRLSALGALGVCQALEDLLPPTLHPQIKWPNDVLLERRKAAGILAEAIWTGNRLEAVIMGIGVNIHPPSLPPPDETLYPATCVEAVLQAPVDRYGLLRQILERLLEWRPRIGSAEFLQAWQERLAFVGERVRVTGLPGSPGDDTGLEGLIAGLEPDGSLRLRVASGDVITLHFGEVGLRPLENGLK